MGAMLVLAIGACLIGALPPAIRAAAVTALGSRAHNEVRDEALDLLDEAEETGLSREDIIQLTVNGFSSSFPSCSMPSSVS